MSMRAVWPPPRARHLARTKLARARRNPQHGNVCNALDMRAGGASRTTDTLAIIRAVRGSHHSALKKSTIASTTRAG
ncbi:hypothetical protein XHC_0517 [Xanthomonas hortorum pv. carotae str. M081]|nr:hypothetical protein XHC_0517 [Xanthomonas hortorum pv. carotae str. M081]